MAGFPVKMDEIMLIANKYNLKVIEDMVHCQNTRERNLALLAM